jgi:signal transduction histidine kinase
LPADRTIYKTHTLSPVILIGLTLVSIIIVAVSIFLEYQARQRDYFALMEKQGTLFIGSISNSTQNAISAAEKMENELDGQIRKNLKMLDELDRRRSLSPQEWQEQLDLLGLEALLVYDAQGRLQIATSNDHTGIDPIPFPLLQARLKNIIRDTTVTLQDGMNPDLDWLAAITSRKNKGLLVAIINKKEIQSFRNLLGIGHLLKRFQSDANIEYVLIQNNQTIVAGSFKDYILTSFSQDPLLQEVWQGKSVRSRIVRYGEKRIFETIAPFRLQNHPFGVLRLGLSMQEYAQLQKEVHKRLYIFLVIVVVFGLIISNLLLSHRHRRLLNRDLLQLRAYTNSILENLHSGVISFNQEGTIQSLNQQALHLLNLDLSEVLYKPYTLLPRAVSSYIQECLYKVQSNQTIRKTWISIKDEQKRLLSLRTDCIENKPGDKSIILLMDDVTDQTLLEEQITRNQRLQAMRTLASSVAHEIKNPLNSIKLLVDLVKKKHTPVENADIYNQRLLIVHQEIDRISTIVDHYLQFSRLPQITFSSIQFPALLAEVATIFDAEFRDKRITLRMQIEPHESLPGDRDQLKQVFINLIKNAEEAIEPPGEILLLGRELPPFYEIRVQDTGKGIDEKDISLIFDFHFSTKKNGSGIGLALAQQIMTAHRSVLYVESEPGLGATFVLRFPLVSEQI